MTHTKKEIAAAGKAFFDRLMRERDWFAPRRLASGFEKPLHGDFVVMVWFEIQASRVMPCTVGFPGWGVRYSPIHDFYAELTKDIVFFPGDPPGLHTPRVSTVSDDACSALRALPNDGSVNRTGRMWPFGTMEDVEIQIPRIVEVLSTDGYAWAAERASLQGIIQFVETYPMKIPTAYETWLQIAYCMKGRYAEARARVEAKRAHLVEVKYPVPDQFKLCDRFLARIDAAAAGEPGLFPPDPDLT